MNEALRRQAEHRTALGQALEARERGGAGRAQGAVGGPGIALVLAAKALGEVHLIAVAGLDVVLDTLECLAIVLGAEVGLQGAGQLECRCRRWQWPAEQLDQALAFSGVEAGVEQQLAGARPVVIDQRPGVQAEARIRQVQVIPGLARQALQMAAEVVAEVADQAAGEGQLIGRRDLGRAQLLQVVPQTLEEAAATFVGGHRQFGQRPGAEQVIATALGTGPATVQQHGAGSVFDCREILGGVGAIGERVYGTGQHAGQISHRSAVGDCMPVQELLLEGMSAIA